MSLFIGLFIGLILSFIWIDIIWNKILYKFGFKKLNLTFIALEIFTFFPSYRYVFYNIMHSDKWLFALLVILCTFLSSLLFNFIVSFLQGRREE